MGNNVVQVAFSQTKLRFLDKFRHDPILFLRRKRDAAGAIVLRKNWIGDCHGGFYSIRTKSWIDEDQLKVNARICANWKHLATTEKFARKNPSKKKKSSAEARNVPELKRSRSTRERESSEGEMKRIKWSRWDIRRTLDCRDR